MKKLVIEGNNTLSGTIDISGSKNAVLALVPAAILAEGKSVIENVPNISDVNSLVEILEYLGATVVRKDNVLEIDSSTLVNKPIPQEISTKLRASYYFMAALLAKYKEVEMYFPGGCNIGARPIDQTEKAFRALGAKVNTFEDRYYITADSLKGSQISLNMPSVGATINAMLVAVKAKGTTVIKNAAREPEIVSVATYLNNMGAKIYGAGTSSIRIEGQKKLHGCYTEVIPDRIEAGTYLVLGSLIGDNLKINNIIPSHLEAMLDKFREMGIDFEVESDSITLSKTKNLKPVNITTQGYPGFVTDLQQCMTVLLASADGESSLTEKIYENRFQHIKYFNQMGSDIEIIDNKIIINGPTKFKGKNVEATDLRAGAALVIAGLIADGKTEITEISHLLRGYENIVNKLKNVGANIKMEED